MGSKQFTPFARALRRAIEQHVENPLVEKILREEIRPGRTVIVDIRNDALRITTEEGENTDAT